MSESSSQSVIEKCFDFLKKRSLDFGDNPTTLKNLRQLLISQLLFENDKKKNQSGISNKER